MVASNLTPRPRAPVPVETLVATLRERSPALLSHCRIDGAWLWYCGPSLKDYPEARALLSSLGFRFARRGHPIKGTPHVGSWGHACAHPTPFRRHRTPAPPRSDETRTSDETDALSAATALGL